MNAELALGLLVVRLALGGAIAAHGAQKLFGWFGGYGLAGTAGFFEQLGFRPGRLFAIAAGFGELAGGLLVAAGLFGAVGPLLIVSTMVVAIFSVHVKNGFFATANGFELAFVYAVAAIAVAFAGPGTLSLDALLGVTLTSQPAIVWGLLVLGALGGFGTLALRRAPDSQAQPAA